FGAHAGAFEFGPKSIFQRALVVEIINFFSMRQLVPCGLNEDDSTPATAGDGASEFLQRAEHDLVILSGRFFVSRFVREKFKTVRRLSAEAFCVIIYWERFGPEDFGLIKGEPLRWPTAG